MLTENEKQKLELIEKLNESQRLAKIGSWEWNIITKELWCSDEISHIFELSPIITSPNYKMLTTFIHPDDYQNFYLAYKHSYENGKILNIDIRLLLHNGVLKYCNVKGKIEYNEDAEVVRYIGTIADLTLQKNSEANLKTNENLFRGLFRNMFEGYAYCKMIYENGEAVDWIYLEVNDNFEKLTGLKNVMGKTVSSVIPGIKEKDPQLFEIYNMVALTGQSNHFEMYLEALQQWFSVSVYSPEKEYFVAIFDIVTKRKEEEEEKVKSQEKLRAFASMLQESRENERKSIAREIHDEFGQVLTALKMNLTVLKKEVTNSNKPLSNDTIIGEIDIMKTIIDQTIQKVRIFTNNLRPNALDTFGLIEALDNYIDDFGKLYHINCCFNKPKKEINLELEQSIAVYRIVQEALTNVAKHARATLVNIVISIQKNNLYLAIEDNGAGMMESQQVKEKSFGITGMKERAYILGAEFTISSTVDRGTKIELKLPLPHND